MLRDLEAKLLNETSQQEHTELRIEIKETNVALALLNDDLDQEVAAKRQELLSPLLEEIHAAINGEAKALASDFILNETSDVSLLYLNPVDDITSVFSKKWSRLSCSTKT